MVFVKCHMACKSDTNVVFSSTRKPILNRSLKATLPSTFGCIYKMLIACVIDNVGKKSYYITNVMFFIGISNTLGSNQNITNMIFTT
jgi:hypothetical protein